MNPTPLSSNGAPAPEWATPGAAPLAVPLAAPVNDPVNDPVSEPFAEPAHEPLAPPVAAPTMAAGAAPVPAPAATPGTMPVLSVGRGRRYTQPLAQATAASPPPPAAPATASPAPPPPPSVWQRLKHRFSAGTTRPVPMPAVGSTRATAAQGAWVLAWASRASPLHSNQDCAGARWLLPEQRSRWAVAQHTGVALAVADGVTQGAAGDVAAQALVRHWLGAAHNLPEAERRAFLHQADTAVTQALSALGSQPGAATGAAAWLGPNGHGWASRVGDCRLLQGQTLTPADAPAAWQLQACMPDQTYGQLYPEWFRPGLPAPLHPEQPACMVGGGRLGEPESLALTLAPGQLLVLCSDGLHSAVPLPQMAELLARHLPPSAAGPQNHPQRLQQCMQAVADDWLQTAADQGSEDDITVLLALFCPPPGHATPL